MTKELTRIYEHFGPENQLKKLAEELLELLEVVKKIQKEGWTKENTDNFVSECVDVLIVMMQHIFIKELEYFFGSEKDRKISRTLERIKSKFYDKI